MYKGAGCGVHELYYIWGVACHDLSREDLCRCAKTGIKLVAARGCAVGKVGVQRRAPCP